MCIRDRGQWTRTRIIYVGNLITTYQVPGTYLVRAINSPEDTQRQAWRPATSGIHLVDTVTLVTATSVRNRVLRSRFNRDLIAISGDRNRKILTRDHE